MVKNNSRRNTKFVSKETIPRFAECSLFGSLWCVNMKSDSLKFILHSDSPVYTF